MTPFEELFLKYIEDRLTPDELASFRELAGREENRSEFNRLLAEWIDRDFPVTLPEDIDVRELYSELTRRHDIPFAPQSPNFSFISGSDEQPVPPHSFQRLRNRNRRRLSLPIAAAASLL